MVSGYPTSTSFSRVGDWSTNPWVLGRHKISSENDEDNDENEEGNVRNSGNNDKAVKRVLKPLERLRSCLKI